MEGSEHTDHRLGPSGATLDDVERPCPGGISGMNLVQVCRWASSYRPYKCILEYGKSIPIKVYTIMEDNKKCSLFPFKLGCLMKKIISTVKC